MNWIAGLILLSIVVFWFYTKKRNLNRARERLSYRIQTSNTTRNTTINRALPGTFDESVFLNPNTNKFKFPKYKSNKNSLIKIQDITDYKNDIWDILEPEEKRTFDIEDFESHYLGAEIEVDNFYTIFDTSASHLEPHKYLKGHGMDLYQLIEDFEESMKRKRDKNENQYVLADAEWIEKLLEDGFLSKYNFGSNEEESAYKVEYLNFLTVAELKNICKNAGLKISLKKAELIEQILSTGCPFTPTTVVIKNNNFDAMMERFCHLYIEDIKKTIDSWHPLVIKDVWSAAYDNLDNEILEKLIKNIIDNAYWNQRLIGSLS